MRSLLAPLGVGLALSTLAACSLFTKLDGYSSGEREIASDGAAPASPVDAEADAAPATDAGGPTYREVVLADRPLAYYRLGDTGAAARDEIGAHDGIYEGTVTHAKGAIAGDDDGAAVFDGTDFVRVGEAFAFLDHAPYTLEAWISVDAALPDSQCVVAKNIGGAPGGGPLHGWSMYLYGTQTRIQTSRYHDGDEEEALGTSIPVGRWAHVIATYDGTNLAFYVDGEPIERAPSPSPIASFANDLTIGASRGGSACRFHGMIDELAIYGAPLSSDRIRAHHRAGIGP